MKRVLMIAFHFPPAAGSSGIQRTLRFVQHLPALGWEPVVLTAHPRAHERTSDDLMREVPASTRVIRSFALDTARHLSIGGRYPGFLARPDRWQTWRFGALASARRLLQASRFDAVWSTYPIATAHAIGAAVSRNGTLPWVADFRDPMAQDGYPADPRTWKMFSAIEEDAVMHARRAVFTTPGAAAMYRERYPSVPSDRIVVIENGFDEESFIQAQGSGGTEITIDPKRTTLLHSGVVYPSERDPTHLMQALAMLKSEGIVSASTFCLRFRASEHDALIRDLSGSQGVGDLIDIAPAVPYRDALHEMMNVDALVVMQASNCNAQIPAKLYEYLRAQRPILGLTDPAGDTARVLKHAGIRSVAALDSAESIAEMLKAFVVRPAERSAWIPERRAVEGASRRARAVELAALLNEVSGD